MKSGARPAAGVGDLEVHAHDVAAEPEEHALAQHQHAATAPGQPDADRDDREAQVLAEQAAAGSPTAGPARRTNRASRGEHERQQRGHACDRSAGSHTRLLVRTVKRPCGRTCRKTTMTRKTDHLGQRRVGDVLDDRLEQPSANAAMTVPLIWPRPPTTTTRNASIR